MAGRPPGAENKNKRFRAALNRYADANPKALDELAEKLFATAMTGDTTAIREVADRLDGKVPQAIVGDEDHPPVAGPEWTDAQRAQALAALMAKTSNGQPSGD